jgi:heme oxygenase
MLIRLALETRAHHGPADEDRLAMMDLTSVADYRTFLARVYGFEADAELALAEIPTVASHVTGLRARVGCLRDDLLKLGLSSLDIDTLPRCKPIAIKTTAHALGWLFVIERSTMIAGLIRRHLASQLPAAMAASGYLDAYGTAAAERMRRFAETASEYATRGIAHPDSIVGAATRAFETQRQWYSRRHHRNRQITQPVVRSKPRDAA